MIPGLFGIMPCFCRKCGGSCLLFCIWDIMNAFRALHPVENGYTYWDYGGGAFQNDLGMRIDYLLLSAQAADRLASCRVDRELRKQNKPSDHTPLIVELNKKKND